MLAHDHRWSSGFCLVFTAEADMSLAERLKTEIKTDGPVLLDRFLNIVIALQKTAIMQKRTGLARW